MMWSKGPKKTGPSPEAASARAPAEHNTDQDQETIQQNAVAMDESASTALTRLAPARQPITQRTTNGLPNTVICPRLVCARY